MAVRPLVVLALALAVAALAPWVLAPHLINHDVAQFMYGGRAALGGLRLYTQFIEMNLPSAYYLAALPALLGEELGIGAAGGLVLFVMAAIAAALGLCAHFLRRAAIPDADWLLLALLVAMLLPAVRHFGQREHLLAVLSLSYALSFLVPRAGIAGVLAGVLAGIAMGQKPYFLVLPLFLELAAPWRQSWRPHAQSVAALLVAGLCLGAGLLRHPEYLTELLPLARGTYGAWDGVWLVMLLHQELMFGLALLLFACRLPSRPETAPVRRLLLAAAMAGLFLIFLQRKGYDYHYLPLMVPALALAALVLADIVALGLAAEAVLAGPLLALGLAVAIGAARVPFDYHRTADQLAPLVARHGGDGVVGGLSIHPFPFFDLLMRHGGRWATRYASLWPLVGQLAHPERPLDDTMRRIRGQLAEDLEREHPCVVVVDEYRWGAQRQGLLAFLQDDAHFARVWAAYAKVAQVDGYAVHSRCPAGQ